jgi:sterol 3beta-glucosyltransferase
VDPSSESSILDATTNDNASASNILARSDVFHSPTINRFTTSPDREDLSKLETARPGSTHDNIIVSPPSRSQNDKAFASNNDQHLTPRPSTDLSNQTVPQTNSSSSLQQLVKGSFPIQKAAGFAGYIKRKSGKMGSLLSTESMNYVEKVSGMWSGGRKHYGDAQTSPNEAVEEPPEADDTGAFGNRFRAHFSLPPTEKLQATYFGYLYRVLPLYGKIYIGDRHFCYRSLLYGTRTKFIVPLSHIENVTKERGFTSFQYGLVIRIRGFEEIFFEFSSTEVRDDCAVTLLQSMENVKQLQDDLMLSPQDVQEARVAKEEHQMLQEARLNGHNRHDINLPKSANAAGGDDSHPIVFDDPGASIINFKPTEPLRITCLTIGTRGDVQPYIALCKGLMAEGHKVKIATHAEYEPWIRQHGIDFALVEGDPAELMKLCVEHSMFSVPFFKEAISKFRGWIDELLASAWTACQDTDLLIESPSAMAGIHIAEALEIPYFRAFSMPWTRTRAYPHAFAVTHNHRTGGYYNSLSYALIETMFWTGISSQVNRWRTKELNLPVTSLEKLHTNKVPFLYNFSPSVVPPPLDYSDWIRVTGYWFLDEGQAWAPDPALEAFIKQARRDDIKLVYIGFGSIVVSDPAALTRAVVDSVLKAGVRCILSKGWSDRLEGDDKSKPEIPLPPEIFQIKSAPHDWLFKQIDAVVHHGGAGTTGASLRAGKPTIIKPFFGDQFFFGNRIEDLRVGIVLKKINVSGLARALWQATHDERMIKKAAVLGEQIRKVCFQNSYSTRAKLTFIGKWCKYCNTNNLPRHGVCENLDKEEESRHSFKPRYRGRRKLDFYR